MHVILCILSSFWLLFWSDGVAVDTVTDGVGVYSSCFTIFIDCYSFIAIMCSAAVSLTIKILCILFRQKKKEGLVPGLLTQLLYTLENIKFNF